MFFFWHYVKKKWDIGYKVYKPYICVSVPFLF